MSYRHSTHIALGFVIMLYSIAVIALVPTNSAFYDAVQVLYLLKRSIAAGVIPVHGILNSQMLYNPPFFVWHYYLPAWFTADPGLVFIIPNLIAQLTTIGLLYLIGRDYFRPTTGLVAATIYAFSPLGLEFGRVGWAYAHAAPLYVAIVFCLFRWLISNRNGYIVPLIVLCGWVTGVHLAGALSFFVVGSAVLVRRTLPPVRPLLLGVGLMLLVWLPFLGFQVQRNFVDIIGLVQPRSDLPDPTELSLLCPPDWDATIPKAKLSEGVTFDRFLSSLHRASYIPYNAFAPWTLDERILALVLAPVFYVALGMLLWRSVRRTATPAEQLLLIVMVVPLVLQSLTPFHAEERPDVTWIWFGVQTLVLGYALTVPHVMQTRPAQIAVLIALSVMISFHSYQIGLVLHAWVRGDLYDRRQEVADVIAADAAQRGLEQVAIRYDLVRDDPFECLGIRMNTISDTTYTGNEFDYYLEYMHQLSNTAKARDGWVETPDYVVARATSPAAAAYTADPARYQPLPTRPPFQVWYYQR